MSKIYLGAFLFIAAGILLICRNVGMIDSGLFNIIVSWPSLVILIGLFSIFRGHVTFGLIIGVVGFYFFAPLAGIMEQEQLKAYWPVILIIIGIHLLLKSGKRRCFRSAHRKFINAESTENGFVNSEVVFGEAERIVLDPVFRGARIKNSFGATTLDLRRTTLPEGETVIDIECDFGGIEIYVPSNWSVDNHVKAFLGDCGDKRYRSDACFTDRKLILKGQVSFGGIEIKS